MRTRKKAAYKLLAEKLTYCMAKICSLQGRCHEITWTFLDMPENVQVIRQLWDQLANTTPPSLSETPTAIEN